MTDTHLLNPSGILNLDNLIGIKKYNSDETYKQNDVVVTVSSGEVNLYLSLVNNNNYQLTDTTKWEEVSLGGGSTYTAGTGIDITNDVISTVALVITDYTA